MASNGGRPGGGLSIGVFDSGLGGLSVVRALWSLEPEARILYVADTAHVPYGGRPGEQVREFALVIIRFLIGQGAGMIAMACNMSSAYALEAAREEFPSVMVLGVLQSGAEQAAEMGGPIGVFATQGTVASGRYRTEIERARPGERVTEVACPELVPLIESGELAGACTEAALQRYLKECGEARTLVLGCTHYPFLLPQLVRLAPIGTRIVDPGRRMARAIVEKEQPVGKGQSRFWLTGPSETFGPVGSRFVGRDLPPLEFAQWQPDGTLEECREAFEVKEFQVAKS